MAAAWRRITSTGRSALPTSNQPTSPINATIAGTPKINAAPSSSVLSARGVVGEPTYTVVGPAGEVTASATTRYGPSNAEGVTVPSVGPLAAGRMKNNRGSPSMSPELLITLPAASTT